MFTARSLLSRSRLVHRISRVSPRLNYPSVPISIQYRAMSDLKSLEVLEASELNEGQVKAVDFDGGRVLLSKVKGEIVGCAGVLR